jgi:hypothetical protein
MSLAIDAAFLTLPETETFNIWRIENFQPVPWTDFGAFYTGDSYIVLSAVTFGTSKRIVRDIYYWIGAESTQDEYGTAAIKTVELDDRFGGEPVQHREVQYHESDLFHNLFDKYGGLRYLDGGVASGFRAVDPAVGVNLYQIKGQRNPILLRVPANGHSLNHGDAFILTSPKALFLWIPKGANFKEKQKAAVFLDGLKPRFKGAIVERLEGDATSPEFWELLGDETPIASADEGGADAATEAVNVRKIYKVDGDKFTLVAEALKATKQALGAGVSIVHRGETVLVYLSKAAFGQWKTAMAIGVKFLTAHNLPHHTEVSVIKEEIACEKFDLIFA